MINAIDWSIWTPYDFGLDPQLNMLTAPMCPCGCGEKAELLLDKQKWREFCMYTLHYSNSDWSIIFTVTINKKMEFIIRNGDKYGYGGGPINEWKDVGKVFDDGGFDGWGMIMENGYYDGQKRYCVM